MSSCIASHLPPPEKEGGGAAATASRTAWISAATFAGIESRNTIAGTLRSGSSSSARWKKWIRHGSLDRLSTRELRRFAGSVAGFGNLVLDRQGLDERAESPCLPASEVSRELKGCEHPRPKWE